MSIQFAVYGDTNCNNQHLTLFLIFFHLLTDDNQDPFGYHLIIFIKYIKDSPMTPQHAHAIVIGGSIGGLLTARILSDYFKQVTLIERDQLPSTPDGRTGTPQGKHVHNLLTRGMKIIESLLPGFEDELVAHGANMANWGRDVKLLSLGGWLQSLETDLYSPVASRALVEWVIRQRVLAIPTVTIHENTDVRALLTDSLRETITGVRVKARGAGGEEQDLIADFVIDVSGRSSKSPEWLKDLGYEQPTETTVDPLVGYATCLYQKPATFKDGWRLLLMTAKAPDTCGGAIFEVENNVWMVSLGGYSGDYPPTDPDGFVEFARSLREPLLYNLIQDATPISDIVGYRRTLNVIHHYEKLSRFPQRFALLGDAVCGFNPIYGQGMTAAAMGVELLAKTFKAAKGDLHGLGRRFQVDLAKQNRALWLLSTGEDFRHKATIGDRPGRMTRLIQQYIDRVIHILPYHNDIAESFMQVMNMNQPASVLFKPSIVWRAFTYRRSPQTAVSLKAQTAPSH